MPEISVIVPVYKVEPYLRHCIDSILAQTFPDIEVILVDDGSPDGCPAICDEYAQLDKRVKVIHQKNQGVSAARNAGLDWVFANSDSQWISFVDSDDWVHPRFLAYLYQAAVEYNVKISVCSAEKADKYTAPSRDATYSFETYNALSFFVQEALLGPVVWYKLYKKLLFKSKRFPVGKLHEDEFLTYLLLHEAKELAFSKCKLYYYFKNESGITNSPYTLSRLDAIDALEEQYKFFSSLKYDDLKDIMLKRLIYAYSGHMNELEHCSEYGARKAYYTLRSKLRRIFPQYRRKYGLDIQRDAWCYEAAYPNFMRLYWKWNQIKLLKKREGFRGVIRKAQRKIFKKS